MKIYSKLKILITGGLGNVGSHVTHELIQQGHDVFIFEMESQITLKQHRLFQRQKCHYKVYWGSVTSEQQVSDAVREVQPDAIVHVAALIPPMSYMNPELAHDINVNGTGFLLRAAKQCQRKPRIVFSSSYSVHGSCNAFLHQELWHENTSVHSVDNYNTHKILCEKMIKESGLPFTILRLPSVASLDKHWGRSPAFITLSFLIPLAQREHGLDARDVGLALANAVTANTENRVLDIGGTEDWCYYARSHRKLILESVGLHSLPEELYKLPCSDDDASWFYENWVDTSESQGLLQYQRYSFKEYLDHQAANRFEKMAVHMLSPLITHQLQKSSPYYSMESNYDSRPFWEVVCEVYDIKESFRNQYPMVLDELSFKKVS